MNFLLFCPFGKELSLSCGLKDPIRFSIFCAQAHVALRHFKGKGLTVLIVFRSPVAIRLCRQCRCAHAQHHAQRHEGRGQPLGQGRLLHMEFLLFAYGGGYASTLKIPYFTFFFNKTCVKRPKNCVKNVLHRCARLCPLLQFVRKGCKIQSQSNTGELVKQAERKCPNFDPFT